MLRREVLDVIQIHGCTSKKHAKQLAKKLLKPGQKAKVLLYSPKYKAAQVEIRGRRRG